MQEDWKKIYVALWVKNQFVPAGIIMFDKSSNISGFQYLSTYSGPPIDPVNLNYIKDNKRLFTVNQTHNPEMLHRVFQDALPGAWGMNVLMMENPELKKMTAAERLFWLGSRNVGGLSCRATASTISESPNRGIDKLIQVRKESIEFFNKKIAKIMDKSMRWGLCSHGGARPKTSYIDNNNEHWLVKFNIDLDGFNGARVENAATKMAMECGINTVNTSYVKLPDNEDVLFIKRYDRGHNAAGEEYKVHQISLFSMLNESSVKTPNGADYADLVKVIREVSVAPLEDVRQLFRQMLFNTAIHNADDHAKNFSMILTDDGYRLAPAYDITPIPNSYPHSMSVAGDGNPTLDEASVVKYANVFGIPKDEAIDILSQIKDVTVEWRAHMRKHGVSEDDIKFLDRAFSNGIDKKMASTKESIRASQPHI